MRCSADPSDFLSIKIHTAKCSCCDQKNKDTILRCPNCSYQICTPCLNCKKGGPLFHGEMLTQSYSLPPIPARVQTTSMAAQAVAKLQGEETEAGPLAKLANTSVETAGQESNESQIPERKAAMTLENLVEEKHAKWEEGGRDKGAILPGLRALGPPKDPLNFGSHVSPFTPTPIRNRDAGTAGQTTKAEGEGIKGRFPSPYLGDPFSSPLYGDESEATPTVGQKGRENINDGVVGSVPIAFLSPENLANANLLPAILAGNTSDGKDMSNAALLQAMPHTTVGDLVKLVAIKLRGEASLDQAQYAEAFRRLEQRAVHFMQSLRDESSPIVLQYVHFSLDTDIKLLNETQAGLLNRILRAVGRTAVADFKKSVANAGSGTADGAAT